VSAETGQAQGPAYDHQANWGWTLKSHLETNWWVTQPTQATARGTYFFRQEVLFPFGMIGLSERSGYAQVWVRGNGTFYGTGA
jgi:hypothetical protein